jgi:hypothetical protein
MSDQSDPNPIASLMAEQRRAAHDQLSLAWRIYIDRVDDQLQRGWRENLSRALDNRLDALEKAIGASVEGMAAARAVDVIENARRQTTERLAQAVRRIDQAEDAVAWGAALLDGAQSFCERVLLVAATGAELALEGSRGIADAAVAPLRTRPIPLAEARAVVTLIESLDTVITMVTAAELSAPLAAAFGEGGEFRRACLIPVVSGRSEGKRRVAAVLVAEGPGHPLDINVLELLAAAAGMALDCRLASQRATTSAPAGSFLNIAMPPPAQHSDHAPIPAAAPWHSLPVEEQEWHASAQRFARVKVAEMLLYRPQEVHDGRHDRDLYSALHHDIEHARTLYRQDFLHVPSITDYLHLEILRTLANDDPTLLGAGYPGPLV